MPDLRTDNDEFARGWFFAAVETFPFASPGIVIGQQTQDSCVAACCRMMLHDYGIEQPEAYLRIALGFEDGAFVSSVPDVLRSFQLPVDYEYRTDLTVDLLKQAVSRGIVVAFVKKPGEPDGHALLLEEITDEFVAVRDPLPQGEGKAYQVRLADFLQFWVRENTGHGNAAIVLE